MTRVARTIRQAVHRLLYRTRLGPHVAAYRATRRPPIEVNGTKIPPASLRLGGHNFVEDPVFLETARSEAKRLEVAFAIDPWSRVLDIGCGVGRLPIGLLSYFGSVKHYTGVDVALGSIAWCEQYIARPGVKFIHLDLANERYNPRGAPISHDFELPLPRAAFDVIYLYSVFSHMKADDVQAYLRELHRLLAPGGGIFLTAFVEPDVEDVAVNPPGYSRFPGEWEGALHCVRFDRAFFEGVVADAGLMVERFDHGTEVDGQSGIYLRLASGRPGTLKGKRR